METCFNYCDDKVAFFSSDERKWLNRIHKLKEQFPEQITIIREPEVNDGCIYCKLPASALRVQLKQKVELSAERKQELSERMKRMHAQRLSSRTNKNSLEKE